MIAKVDSSIEIIKDNDNSSWILKIRLSSLILTNRIKVFKSIESKKINLIKSYKEKSYKKAITKDRIKIDVMCNLELSEEVKLLNMDSDGIGLFRTEYLYMNRNDLPTEHEQVQAYKKFLIN